MVPKRNAEVPPSVAKSKKAVTCFVEKIHVLDELRSGVS